MVHDRFLQACRKPAPFQSIHPNLGPSHFEAKEGYGALARLAKDHQLSLWYLRPKIHMMQHVLFLACIFFNGKQLKCICYRNSSGIIHGIHSSFAFFHSFCLRLDMKHQLSDPNCQHVLNPHSGGLTRPTLS